MRFLTGEGPCCGVIEGDDVAEIHLKQSTNASEMLFKIPQVISFITQVMTLPPGDVILTETVSARELLESHSSKITLPTLVL